MQDISRKVAEFAKKNRKIRHYVLGHRFFPSFLLRYNHPMNKRAKKRLLESIKKDKLERTSPAQKPMPTSRKDPKHQTGFLPRHDKKRG